MKKTKNTLLIFIVATFVIAPFALCVEQPQRKPVAIFVDFDNVLTKNHKPKITDFALLGPILFAHPIGTLYGLWNYEKIKNKGKEFAQDKTATTESIINSMIGYLKQEGYGDFSGARHSLIKLAVQPIPIAGSIKLLYELKKEGYVLIGATNQRYSQSVSYRNKLKEHGIDIYELFDAILTTYSDDVKIIKNQKPEKSTAIDMRNRTYMGKRTYMTNQGILKPDPQYYETLKELAKKFGAHDYHFIDDQDINVTGAQQCGINGIQFDLPKDKSGNRVDAVNASRAELDYAVDCLKKSLESKGIIADLKN